MANYYVGSEPGLLMGHLPASETSALAAGAPAWLASGCSSAPVSLAWLPGIGAGAEAVITSKENRAW